MGKGLLKIPTEYTALFQNLIKDYVRLIFFFLNTFYTTTVVGIIYFQKLNLHDKTKFKENRKLYNIL